MAFVLAWLPLALDETFIAAQKAGSLRRRFSAMRTFLFSPALITQDHQTGVQGLSRCDAATLLKWAGDGSQARLPPEK